MKKIALLLLLLTIYFAQKGHTQTTTISLQQYYGLDMGIDFDYDNLYEVKNISKFEIPEDIDNFTIKCLEMFPQNASYKMLANNKKGKSVLAKQGIDTLQFLFLNPKTTKLYALIFMQKGVKNLILDTDFNNSFLNEQIYQFDFNTMNNNDEPAFIHTDLQLPVELFQNATVKKIPVKILMNEINSDDKMENNDSLQVYVSPDFFYQGYFMYDADTVVLNLKIQNYDLLYHNKIIRGTYFCKPLMANPKRFDFFSGKPIQIKNRKYQFEDFNVIDKTFTITRLEDDSIGTQSGNYLAPMPQLDSLCGYTLLFFTGSWCKPCKILLDSLLLFHQQHPETNIISINNERDSVQFNNYIDKYQIPWKVILDMESMGLFETLKNMFDKDSQREPISYTEVYDIDSFPTIFLINFQRKILHVADGLDESIKLLKKIDEFGYEVFETLFK